MFATETDNPQPEAVQADASAELTKESTPTDTTPETPAEEPTAVTEAEVPEEAEAPEEEMTAAETETSQEAPPAEPDLKPIIDYLAPNLLGDITTVTPEQLKSMEESEIEARNESLEELISASVGEIREDRVIKGRVIGSNDREVLVDIGFKSEGIVAREEFGSGGLPAIGDEITVYLVRMEDINGQTVLSKEKADFMGRWAELKEKEVSEETVLGTVSRRIKGGLIVDLDGVPAFLPGSQVDIRPVQDFDDYIGREFEFKIVKINESRKNIVLSRKELLEADMKEKRADLISGLEVGQVLEGRVKNLTDFGAFVDLGGLDGLLHITDLSWGRVQHPSEVVSLDEVITIKVIDFDPEKQRVSLGLKQLQPHPWDTVDTNFPAGSVISGKVVSMTNYGAFVELERGVEGLVHVSEMSWTKHIRHPSEMFTLGEIIEAKILSVDLEERKISLGVKQLQPDPWDHIEERYAVDSIQDGVVRNLTQFGAFVELEEGIDGLIHVTDLSWTRNVRHPKEVLDKGDEVKVRILDVSKDNRRIALGLKQVNDDPWEQLEAFFTAGKQIEGEVFRILEKGVILQMEMDIEGIIPARDLPKAEKDELLKDLNAGDVLAVTVQELNADDKKVVLMPDFEVKSKALKKKEQTDPAAEKEATVEEVAVAEEEDKAEPKAQPEEVAATDDLVAAEAEAPSEAVAEAVQEALAPAEAEAPIEAVAEAGGADETAAAPSEEKKPKKTAAKKKAAGKSKVDKAEAVEGAEKPKKAAAKKTVAKKKPATKKSTKATSKSDEKKAGTAKKKATKNEAE